MVAPDHACERCGSRYRVSSIELLAPRRTSLACEVCGETLLRWTEARDYFADLVERIEWPPPQPPSAVEQGP